MNIQDTKNKKGSGKIRIFPDHFFPKGKKGIVEAQLTWVFILIVGVIILLFFIGIAQKQKQIADMKASANILQQLDAILTGAEVSSGTSSLIKIPKMELKLDCNSFSIGGITKPLKTRVVFSPDLIKGRQLITYNLDWSVPYRVTNFLYLTSPEVRYILVGDAEDLDNDLPDVINKEVVYDINNIENININNYKVKFIFKENNNPSQNDFPDLKEEISAINILDDQYISFYNDGEWSDSVRYYDTASLLGAIFAEDQEQYECAMKKAFEKFNVVTAFYKKRIELLNQLVPQCNLGNLNLPGQLDFGKEIPISDIQFQNDQLQVQSCPTIY